jgi:hypothetical protein
MSQIASACRVLMFLTFMSESFTQLWTNDRCKALQRHIPPESTVEVLFGGDHQSAPGFTRFGVSPGDFIYPVRVFQGQLFLLGRMTVGRVIPLAEYLTEHLHVSPELASRPSWEVEKQLAKEMPEQLHRVPFACVDEAALAEEATPLRFDIAFPGELLESIRFISKKSERPLKYVENGLLKRAVSLQGGLYRLSQPSAEQFARIIERLEKS